MLVRSVNLGVSTKKNSLIGRPSTLNQTLSSWPQTGTGFSGFLFFLNKRVLFMVSFTGPFDDSRLDGADLAMPFPRRTIPNNQIPFTFRWNGPIASIEKPIRHNRSVHKFLAIRSRFLPSYELDFKPGSSFLFFFFFWFHCTKMAQLRQPLPFRSAVARAAGFRFSFSTIASALEMEVAGDRSSSHINMHFMPVVRIPDNGPHLQSSCSFSRSNWPQTCHWWINWRITEVENRNKREV